MHRHFVAEQLESRRLLSVNINGLDTGRIFDGLGALSNSSSRLLYDYPEPARSQMLDYMFKPGYGAALQILKVEIGGDTNSTDIAEPSHERTRGVFNYTSGFEWWLMQQAKARNPNIKLYALEWGAPGWFTGGFYSQDNINYITSYLDGAQQQQGLNFDYVGGWNESVANPSTAAMRSWFINLKAALQINHPNTKLVAYDDGGGNWRIADDMVNYPDFGAAIDILGQHSPGVWRSLYQTYTVTSNAVATGKPLWASEQSAESHDVGGPSWARGIVRAYEQAHITASLAWCAIDSFYPSMNHADTGIILAENPWSGYYDLGSMVWVFAHTTQFTQPGWQYLDNACGQFPSGATYVTLKSNTTNDYSTVIEAMDGTGPDTETFNVSGGLSTGTVHVWASNIASATLGDDFIHVQDITPVNGTFSITIQPGYVYTLSTTTGQSKGAASFPASPATQMPLPYSEDFESYGGNGKLAKYWADVQGGFETAPATGGRTGTVYRQVVSTPPIAWGGGTPAAPTSMMGDMRWWGDYQFSSDVLLEQSGYVEIMGRAGGAPSPRVSGYHFRISDSGAWSLFSEEINGVDTTLASGSGISFPLNTWHNMSLKMTGNQIAVLFDGNTLATVTNNGFVTGNVAIRVSNMNGAYQNAQFDNMSITRTATPPVFVPHSQMTAQASDTYGGDGGFFQGTSYRVDYAIDDRPESIWHSAFNPRVPPPHWYLVDMGEPETVEGLTYQPRLDGNNNGMVNTYNVLVSNDGVNFITVVSGAIWPTSGATKMASWPAVQARYVELYETAGVNGLMSIGELNIIQTRSSTAAAPDLADSSDTGVSSTDNITRLNNSAGNTLQFAVSGTTAGALVRLYADGNLIGTATASGSTTTVVTDGATTLADGAHTFTATQQLPTMAESLVSAALLMFVDTTPPGASLGSSLPTTGGTTFDFAVTYNDANNLDASTVDVNDVTITGPGGSLPVISVSIPDPTNGSPRTVNYRVNAPGGFWNDADDGLYTVTQVAGQVQDGAGVARSAGTIGSLNVNNLGYTWMDGGVLNVAFNGTTTPITLNNSSGDVTVVRNSTAIGYNNVTSVNVIGTSSADTLNFNGPITPPVTFNGGAGADTLNVNSGTYTFGTDANESTSSLSVNVIANAIAMFNATQHLAALTIANNGSAIVATNGDRFLQTKTLSIATSGRLDLNDNDLVVDNGDFTTVQALVFQGYRQSADASATGIISTTGQTAPGNPILALFSNALIHSPDYPFGSGNTISANAVVGKYTYFGDTNLDGRVTADDYGALDANFGMTSVPPGIAWLDGDTNFDGTVTADDYGTLDANFGNGIAHPLSANGQLVSTPVDSRESTLALPDKSDLLG